MKRLFSLLLLAIVVAPAAQAIIIETEEPEVIVLQVENENCPHCINNKGGTGTAGRLGTKEAY